MEPFPERELRDHARTGLEAAIAAVPVVGGSMQLLAEHLLTPSIERRRDAWSSRLGELVDELRERPNVTVDDERFVTAVIEASRIAIGTHVEEKLDLLKRLLLHVAISNDSGEFRDRLYFRFIDELTTEHFAVLDFIGAKKSVDLRNRLDDSTKANLGDVRDAILLHYGVDVPRALLLVIVRDLDNRGLVNGERLLNTLDFNVSYWGKKQTTELGDELLGFVRLV